MGKVTSTELKGVLSLCIAKVASGTGARRENQAEQQASAAIPEDRVIPVNLVVG